MKIGLLSYIIRHLIVILCVNFVEQHLDNTEICWAKLENNSKRWWIQSRTLSSTEEGEKLCITCRLECVYYMKVIQHTVWNSRADIYSFSHFFLLFYAFCQLGSSQTVKKRKEKWKKMRKRNTILFYLFIHLTLSTIFQLHSEQYEMRAYDMFKSLAWDSTEGKKNISSKFILWTTEKNTRVPRFIWTSHILRNKNCGISLRTHSQLTFGKKEMRKEGKVFIMSYLIKFACYQRYCCCVHEIFTEKNSFLTRT